MLPFVAPPAGPDGRVASAILPATLVALLVACGYREQAYRYRAARRVTARLHRDGQGWIVDELARLTPNAKLDELREAMEQATGETAAAARRSKSR